MEENNNNNNKSKSSLSAIILTIILIGISFTCGYLVSEKSVVGTNCLVEEVEKENKIEIQDNTEDEKVSVVTNDEVTVTDKFAVSTYGDVLRLFVISNGKVYYRISEDRFVGLNACSMASGSDLCKTNSKYNNSVTEIKEINNATRIKFVNDINATDEHYIYFVITDTKVYKLEETMDLDGNYNGVKVEEIQELANKKIVDLLGIEEKQYIFITNNNEQVKYK